MVKTKEKDKTSEKEPNKMKISSMSDKKFNVLIIMLLTGLKMKGRAL